MDKPERKEILFPGDPGFEYFDDEERELIALDLDQGGPLLGMGSLPNWVSTIELKVNGEVRIEPIEQKRGG